MATINLDALIPRSDFCEAEVQAVQSSKIENIAGGRLFDEGVNIEEILDSLSLQGKVISTDLREKSTSVEFSSNTKSALFLRSSIEAAHICPLCKCLVPVEQSVSYDHIVSKFGGGTAQVENSQMTHPYCNSIKGSS